ncbi:MAG: peptidylprolyl isomerase [Verrucomicrobiota bacterium]
MNNSLRAPGVKTLFLLFLLLLSSTFATHAGTFVQFRLPIGDIEVELYNQDKPVTVQNFIRYIQSDRYTTNHVIHRWDPNFVIQGGGFFITNRTTSPSFASVPTFGTITNEYSVGATYSNTYGTIAMARVGGQTNSATSQWFINLGNNSFLDNVDGGFTVFGRVIRGFDVLERFNTPTLENGIFLANLGGALTELPVLSQSPTYNDLVYVDITLLNVKVVRVGNDSQISWNSVTGKQNIVEYTAVLPPNWQTLTTVTGDGATKTVTDANPATRRFYRVRVAY